jgi:glyoxylase-like metal-dependent hydrolase (beta-lactamase superfamily II)
VQFVWETYARIEERIVAVQSGEEFMPGLRLFAAPGHRHDHSILTVTSGAEQLVHLSDAVVHPLFMAHRDWYSTYDADPAQAVETKAKLLDMCVSSNALVFGAHFPFPGLGYVRLGQEGWRWEPVTAT